MTTDSGHPIVCVDPSGRPYGSTPQTLIASSPNAKKLIAFYHRLGIAIELQTDKNGQQAAIGRCPGFAAKFVAGQPGSREPAAPLCFLVDNMATLLQRLMSAGGRVTSPAHDDGDWNIAIVADPEGRKITIMQRIVLAAMVAEANESTKYGQHVVPDDQSAPPVETSNAEAHVVETSTTFAIPAAIGTTVRSFPWGMKVVLASFALMFITACVVYFAVDRREYFEPNSSPRKVMAVVSIISAVALAAGMLQMLRLGSGTARALAVAAAAATVGGELIHAYAYFLPFEPNRSLIHDAALIRLIGLILVGVWYCNVPQIRTINPAWARYWFLPLLVAIMSADYFISAGSGEAEVAFFLLGVLGGCVIGSLLLLYYGWVAICIRLGDRMPEFLKPARVKRDGIMPKQLEPEQLKSLRIGTTMILAGIGGLMLLAGASFMLSEPRPRNHGSTSTMPVVLSSLAVLAAVVQILGKLVLVRVGTKIEGFVLLVAISIEAVGVMLRCAAFVSPDPHEAAMMLRFAFLCHGNELFLAYFFWSLTSRVGTQTSLNLSRALFACMVAIVGAILMTIFLTRSRDAMEFAFGTVAICGTLGFVLLLALLNSLRRLAGDGTSNGMR